LLFAHSLSLRAAGVLRPGVTGRVLASFRSVCDLVTDAGEVVALVWGEVGNGPLNVVLERGPAVAAPAGARFAVMDQGLRVGAVAVDLSRATRWDARPDWPRLHARWGRRWLKPPADTGENLLKQVPHPPGQCAEAHFSHIGCRLKSVAGPAVEAAVVVFEQARRHGSSADLRFAVCNLLGLGPGLTPAGDDWLAGWLLGQHLGGDLTGLRYLSGLILEIAAGRTTTLSHAFLECAAAGEADESWHELLDALAGEDANQQISKSANQRIGEATARIMRHGATSGAAMLAGFFSAVEMFAFTEN
jgi:hypothetical protein